MGSIDLYMAWLILCVDTYVVRQGSITYHYQYIVCVSESKTQ